jgi:bacteriocin-like protein
MSTDDLQDPGDAERTDQAATGATEELSDESLEQVSGGVYTVKSTISPFDTGL